MAPHLEGHEIAFNASDRKSWKKYARSMDEYLRRESFHWNGQPILSRLYPQFFLQCRLGKEALCRLNVFFFPFQGPAFVRLNQEPEAGRAWLRQPFIDVPLLSLSFSQSLSLCFSVQRWRSGEEEHPLHTGAILHAGQPG